MCLCVCECVFCFKFFLLSIFLKNYYFVVLFTFSSLSSRGSLFFLVNMNILFLFVYKTHKTHREKRFLSNITARRVSFLGSSEILLFSHFYVEATMRFSNENLTSKNTLLNLKLNLTNFNTTRCWLPDHVFQFKLHHSNDHHLKIHLERKWQKHTCRRQSLFIFIVYFIFIFSFLLILI